jgi:ATP-dependent Lon protease
MTDQEKKKPRKKSSKKKKQEPSSPSVLLENMPMIGQGDDGQDGPEIPKSCLLLPVGQVVLYPHVVAPIALSEESSLHLKLSGTSESKVVTVATYRPDDGTPGSNLADRVYQNGTAALVLKIMKGNDGATRILLHGLKRVAIKSMDQENPFPMVSVKQVDEMDNGDLKPMEIQAMRHQILDVLSDLISLANLPEEFFRAAEEMEDIGRLADLIASNVSFKTTEQQELLETLDKGKRLRRVYELLEQHLQMLQLGSQIQNEVRSEIERNQRDFFLREQIKQLHRELGDEESYMDEGEELRQMLEKAELPQHAHDVAAKEIGRLNRISPSSPEYSVARTYIEWIFSLPWNKQNEINSDISVAKKVLDEDHYDLEEVKDRILEYLAVHTRTQSLRAPILCFVGPPGVGKTSLGRSIARATGREFYRFSVGGMRDEAEIRGHRRTYIGALPGRIIKAFKHTQTLNPVIMLDEIDKLGSDFRGDPASALLEVLDPEQNSTFVDNYLDIPFDLSKTLFLTTANMLETIPGPLRDRMEIIRLSGYTTREKLEIAERYIVPKQAKENGLKRSQIKFHKAALQRMVEEYTREAGLRELERMVGRTCRKVVRKIAEKKIKTATISPRTLSRYLGKERYLNDTAHRVTSPGVSVGLAWTKVGGEILFIEANSTQRGKGQLRLTGQLGDVMKESAQAAYSFLKANAEQLGLNSEDLATRDFHVHIPAGAIPKDGPSAGITILTALTSELLDKTVKRLVAMTGEVTLKGNVLPVGGIKEKMLAAARAGIKTVLLPERNRKDMEDVPDEVKKKLEFIFVDRAEDVLRHTLNVAPKKSATSKTKTRRNMKSKSASAAPKRSKRKTVSKSKASTAKSPSGKRTRSTNRSKSASTKSQGSPRRQAKRKRKPASPTGATQAVVKLKPSSK